MKLPGSRETAIEIQETQVPIQPAVAAACEALGLDPFTVANEGKMVIVVAASEAERALELIHASRYGQEAQIIGEVKIRPGRPGAGAHGFGHRPAAGDAFRGTVAQDLLNGLFGQRKVTDRRKVPPHGRDEFRSVGDRLDQIKAATAPMPAAMGPTKKNPVITTSTSLSWVFPESAATTIMPAMTPTIYPPTPQTKAHPRRRGILFIPEAYHRRSFWL